MNIVDVAKAGLAGFLISLVVLECLRPVVGSRWPVQEPGPQLERRLLPWAIALLAGPALMWDQSHAYRRGGAGTTMDLAVILALIAAWSTTYGMSLSWAVERLL